MKQKFILLIALIIFLVTTGCAVSVSGEPFETPVPTPTNTVHRFNAFVLPSSTPRPTFTPTFTPAPPTATPTETAIPTPTTQIVESPPPALPTSTLPSSQTASPTPATTNTNTTPTLPPTFTPARPVSAPTTEIALASNVPLNTGSAPTVKEDSIRINTFNYQPALMPTTPDDPVYPYPRLDHNKVGAPSPKDYRAIILENRYTQLTILPDLGGRIYRWVDKTSGQNLFYENPVIKPTSWGNRGWWLATGGMEWALPVDEHGLNEAFPWEYTLYQHDTVASVSLTDTEENSGLVSEVNIALDAEHAYFTLTPRIINPTDQPIPYKFWINGMFDLGSKQPKEGIRFVLPGDSVTVHSTGDTTLPAENQLMSWPNFDGRAMNDYGNWQKHLGVFAAPSAQDNFMGAFNHDTRLGVARVFPHQLARGAKIFAPGDLDPALWTTDNSSYFELWGGLAPTFQDKVTLDPGAWVTWQEQWYAVGDMGGFSYANSEAALNLGVLADSVQLAAASTHPIAGNLVLWNNAKEVMRWPTTIYPESPFRSSLSASAAKGGQWGLSLFDSTGQEVAALGKTLPTLPNKNQPQVVQAAAVSNPTATATATRVSSALPTPATTGTATAELSIPQPITPTIPSTPVALAWDPRLSDLDVSLTRGKEEPDQSIFRLVSAKYLDEWEAAGLHHVFVNVLDEQGQRIVGQPLMLGWKDGQSKMITEDKPTDEFSTNAPLYGSKKDGTYKVYVDGAPSDVVNGLGLPGKHHVSYQLTFQRGAEFAGAPATPRPTIEPTSTPAASSPSSGGGSGGGNSAAWDPRLDDLGIKVNRGQPKEGKVFRLVSAKFQDHTESGGMHHVFVEVLNEGGQRITGQKVTMAWADGKNTLVTEDKPYPEYATNAPMYGPMDQGTYKVYVDGTASDVVTGLGLPGNHHVNYLLTFQRKNN